MASVPIRDRRHDIRRFTEAEAMLVATPRRPSSYCQALPVIAYGLVAAVVVPRDDVLRDVPSAPAERYRRASSSFRLVQVARDLGLLLRPAGAGSCSPETAYGSANEREKQGEDARDAQDSAQPLLRGGLLGALLGSLWQRDAGELIYETNP